MKEIIQLVIQKTGYRKGPYWWPIPTERGITLSGDDQDKEYLSNAQIVLDPQFWQCLGEAMGWAEKITTTSADSGNHWQIKAHEFLDVILDGGNTEKFWKNLLSDSPKANLT
jgi:hypothetical protein